MPRTFSLAETHFGVVSNLPQRLCRDIFFCDHCPRLYDNFNMSFGFSIGDFLGAAQLAHQLYKNIYLVARDAPQELQQLQHEIGILALSLDLLVDEIKNDQSPLVLAGESRQRMVNEVLKQSNATLKDLEIFAQK